MKKYYKNNTAKIKRKLEDLTSVGTATLKDFMLLGIQSVEELACEDAHQLYLRLSELTGQRQDPCVEDVFSAAIAQAKDQNLPKEKCQWWYWSGQRKNNKSKVKSKK